MTPDFMRQKAKRDSISDSEAKMKRKSAIERSETMDLSNLPHNLRRNNSFIESRNFLEIPSRRPSTNGHQQWTDLTSMHDVTAKKPPPSVSPRNSLRRTRENGEVNGSANPLRSSASMSCVKNEEANNNIRRVQEKSNKFLEQLSQKESPKKKLITSASSSSIPTKILEAVAISPVEGIKQNHKLALEDMKKALARETHKRHYYKIRIVDDKKRASKFMQINEVYVSKASLINVNQIHKVRTKDDCDYHVRMKFNESIPDGVIEIHPVLAKALNIDAGVQIEVFETKLVSNCIENIEVVPHSDISENNFGLQIAKDIDEKFKKYVNTNTRILPLILNQNQIFKLDDYLLTIKLYPQSTPACCIDSEILREGIIDVLKRGEPHEFAGMLMEEREKKKKTKNDEISNKIELKKHQEIIEKMRNLIHPAANKFRTLNVVQNNAIIAGPPHSGKSTICSEIKSTLELRNINVTSLNCAQYKGRKVDSIVKDMKAMLMGCLQKSPAVFLIFNLDSLCAHSHDEQQTQESEYLQKLSNGLRHLFEEFTHDYGNCVSIVVTVSNLTSLSRTIHKSFGSYLFGSIIKIPNLEANDRRELFKKLFSSSHIKVHASLDWEKFVRTTEGYKIGDVCQFADRAIYFAVKENFKAPLLTDEILQKSLAISNQLCLEGIKTETNNTDGDDNDKINANEKIPGMDEVIATLEEVLVWPTKFPKIFQNSPLRNQAGILLFGIPGSGKGFIVSQITKRWNLRLISIKGPELLAKYIGQSEENVRNVFEKAKSASPSVLFFDEFESLAPRRGHDSTGVTDRVVNQLLTELDGVKSLEGVTIICASSRPDLIDPALLRSGRIDRLVECVLPNAAERLEILQWLSKSLNVDESVDLKALAAKMHNFTGADIKSVLTTANMNAIEEELKKSSSLLDKVIVRQEHLIDAFKNTRPSLTQQDIQKYQVLYNKFKNKKSVTIETPQKVSLA